MAWVRRVRTTSGATAVQVAEYVDGRRRIVAHVGSARSEAELVVLLERARGLLVDRAQGELDLGVPESRRQVGMVPPVVPENAQGLFADPVLGSDPVLTSGRGGQRVSAPRVVGTSSRVVFDVLAELYTELGFAVVGDETFRDLVIARVVEPTSIRDTPRVLVELGQRPVSEKTMRRTLNRSLVRGYRDLIAAACFAHAASSGDVSLCLYDVTTLYFEAEKEDEGPDGLRKVGYSKERRVDPQVVVGLLVDRAGFPLEIGCFAGNKAETATIVPIVKQFQQRHNLADMVVVADAGMLSAANLKDLDQAGLRFIVGSRLTKAPLDLESHFRWHGDAFTDAQVIDTITPKTRRTIENDTTIKAEPLWNPREHPGSWRAVWAYSTKRAARDNRTLNAQENRAKAIIAGEKTLKATRFVTTSNGDKTLDQASLARARRLVGLKGYVTNITAEIMPASEVITSYHNLWQVEASFRMSKTDLHARPMFHHTQDSIEAHLSIVFTALAISREIQNRTGLSIRNVLRQLRPLRSATITLNGAEHTFPPDIPPDQRMIIDAIRQGPTQALGE